MSEQRKYDPNKDPIYQPLLAAQGWAKRAEDLLFAEKMDRVALEHALWEARNSIWTAIGRFYNQKCLI